MSTTNDLRLAYKQLAAAGNVVLAESDRLREVNATLLEACKAAVRGRMSDRATLVAARKLCRDAIAAAEAAERP